LGVHSAKGVKFDKLQEGREDHVSCPHPRDSEHALPVRDRKAQAAQGEVNGAVLRSELQVSRHLKDAVRPFSGRKYPINLSGSPREGEKAGEHL
jgi:hypothetical protein